MACQLILSARDCRSARRLSQAVGLADLAAEADLEEVEDVFVDRGRSGAHDPHISTQDTLSFLEDKRIPTAVSDATISLQVCLLGCDCFINQPLFAASRGFKCRF